MTSWEIWLDDYYGNRIQPIKNFNSFQLARVANGVGAWAMRLSGDTDPAIFRKDSILEFWRKPLNGSSYLEFIGFVRKYKFSTDDRGMDWLDIGGGDPNYILTSRIVAYYAGSGYAQLTDHCDDIMQFIIWYNFSTGVTDTARNMPQFISGSLLNQAPSHTKGCSWANVLKVLQEVANYSASQGVPLYFEVVPVVTPTAGISFIFRTSIYQLKQDLTANSKIVFSLERGNLSNPVLEYDYTNEINWVYTGGANQGADRIVHEYGVTAEATMTPYARREYFLDARNVSNITELGELGAECYNKNKPRLRFGANLLDSEKLVYGVDWHYGDKVTASYRGQQFVGAILAAKISVDQEGTEMIETKMEVA